MRFKVFNVYLDDGKDTFKVVVPAENVKQAKQYVSGNGEIVAIREDKDIYIDINELCNDLKDAGWGRNEIDVIQRTLAMVRLDEPRK